MKNALFVLILLSAANNAISQGLAFPQQEVNRLCTEAFEQHNNTKFQENHSKINGSLSSSLIKGINEIIRSNSIAWDVYPNTVNNGDTLVVGFTPKDTLFVSGTWNHNGHILVLNDGVVMFKNAVATIFGDLYVVGEGKIISDSSTLIFPQQFFYQRTILVFQKGHIDFNNTTLNYGGFNHNFTVSDSGTVVMNNITQTDFTTTGISGDGSITINKCNLTGEFIVMNKATLNLSNVNDALIWYHIPGGAVVNQSFPSGLNLSNFTFNKNIPGVSGIEYNVQISSSTNIKWGLMPLDGSDLTISNSEIRAIGLWFHGSDSSYISGLVNNSTYSDFTAPLSDRNLHLVNTSLQTWSLYVFDSKIIQIKGCILGEVGAFGTSKVTGESYWVDASGGYCFASDNSFYFNANVIATSFIRSERNAMMIFAYSTQSYGTPTAIGQSILILAQSTVPQDPIPFDKSVVCVVNIEQPSTITVNSTQPIIGSAWIDKTKSSPLMDFAHYRLYFQKNGDTNWVAITPEISIEKKHESLADWNTQGLEEGKYTLKLVLTDSWGNKIEAKKTITLQIEQYHSVVKSKETNLAFYPNPFSSQAFIEVQNPLQCATLILENIYGQKVIEINNISGKKLVFDRADLPSGVYFVKLYQDNETLAIKKIMIED